MSTQKKSPPALSDPQWPLMHRLLPRPKWQPGGPGCPPCDLRRVVNGILYLTKTGCQWRMLPKEFGCWQTISGYFNRWSRQGVWQQILEALGGEPDLEHLLLHSTIVRAHQHAAGAKGG